MAGWKCKSNNSYTTESELCINAGPSAFQFQESMLKSDKIWCRYLVTNCISLWTFWMPLVDNELMYKLAQKRATVVDAGLRETRQWICYWPNLRHVAALPCELFWRTVDNDRFFAAPSINYLHKRPIVIACFCTLFLLSFSGQHFSKNVGGGRCSWNFGSGYMPQLYTFCMQSMFNLESVILSTGDTDGAFVELWSLSSVNMTTYIISPLWFR